MGRSSFVATWILFACIAATGAAKDIRIAIIPRAAGGDFWDAVHAGALKAKKDLATTNHLDVDLFWLPPGGEGTAADQAALIDKVAHARFDGLALAPIDPAALKAPVDLAARDGLPILIFETPLSSARTIGYIGTNHFEAGQLAAGLVGKLSGGQGAILLVGDPEKSGNAAQCERGFVDGARIYPNLFLLSGGDYAETVPAARPGDVPALLKKYNTRITGLFVVDPAALDGTLQAVQGAGLGDRKLIQVAFGSSQAMIGALREERLQGLVIDSPFEIGYRMVRMMTGSLLGQKVGLRNDVPVALLTPEKLRDPANAEVLNPPVAEYLKLAPDEQKPTPPAPAAAAAPVPAKTPAIAPQAP
jgi:ribose transport system substrate-binding protein